MRLLSLSVELDPDATPRSGPGATAAKMMSGAFASLVSEGLIAHLDTVNPATDDADETAAANASYATGFSAGWQAGHQAALETRPLTAVLDTTADADADQPITAAYNVADIGELRPARRPEFLPAADAIYRFGFPPAEEQTEHRDADGRMWHYGGVPAGWRPALTGHAGDASFRSGRGQDRGTDPEHPAAAAAE